MALQWYMSLFFLLFFTVFSYGDCVVSSVDSKEEMVYRYRFEQMTTNDFSRVMSVDYRPYLASYLFAVYVDAKQQKIQIISESGQLLFTLEEIDEIRRRVLFMDSFEENMDRDYFPTQNKNEALNPRRFCWQKYFYIPYSPFSSVNSTETHLYGFVNRPKNICLIAGVNFLEEGPFGKQTNPQPVFLDYEFGRRLHASLEERKDQMMRFLRDEFQKSKEALISPKNIQRFRFVNDACTWLGKSKKDVRVLDIGCSMGRDLNLFRAYGFQHLYGIDMDRCKIEIVQSVCREKKVDTIHVAPIHLNAADVVETIKKDFQVDCFDVILLNNTIEHISDPLKTMSIVASLLAKDGVVFFSGIPDENSLAAQFEETSYGDYDKFTHLNFFTRETVQQCAKTAGFSVEFLPDDNGSPNLPGCFVFEECLPYVVGGKWFLLGRELPEKMAVQDVFLENSLAYNLYSTRPKDGNPGPVNFERYKLYKKHKDHIVLLYKNFFIETLKTTITPIQIKNALWDLKHHLFNTLVLDTPTGIDFQEKETLLSISDEESAATEIAFWNKYQISFRTMSCFMVFAKNF